MFKPFLYLLWDVVSRIPLSFFLNRHICNNCLLWNKTKKSFWEHRGNNRSKATRIAYDITSLYRPCSNFSLLFTNYMNAHHTKTISLDMQKITMVTRTITNLLIFNDTWLITIKNHNPRFYIIQRAKSELKISRVEIFFFYFYVCPI